MRRLKAAIALVLIIFGATEIATAAAPEPRVALVIGNSAYEDTVNDARLMAETLRGLGFDVIERTDADQREMKLAIFELGDRLEAAGKDAVGLFFYAGHGVEVNGPLDFARLVRANLMHTESASTACSKPTRYLASTPIK